MSTNVYSIRIDDRVRRMMDEMIDVNWQADQAVGGEDGPGERLVLPQRFVQRKSNRRADTK